jgi:hypothetical protein
MLVKMENPVAGEMYLPGATIKMSKTLGRVGLVPTPASTPTRSAPGFSATMRGEGHRLAFPVISPVAASRANRRCLGPSPIPDHQPTARATPR